LKEIWLVAHLPHEWRMWRRHVVNDFVADDGVDMQQISEE
jgi:hypothetical protein